MLFAGFFFFLPIKLLDKITCLSKDHKLSQHLAAEIWI